MAGTMNNADRDALIAAVAKLVLLLPVPVGSPASEAAVALRVLLARSR